MSLTSYLPLHCDLRDMLGHGPFGSSLRGIDTRTQSDVVVKQIAIPPWLSGAERAERVRRLCGALDPSVEVRHAHVATVRQVVGTENGLCVVRDYVPGASLAARLRQAGPMSRHEVSSIASQVGSALDCLAKSGLSHGALNLRNIVLGPSGEACVTDAGVATAARQRFEVAGRSVGYAGAGAEVDDVRAFAHAVCAMLSGVPEGYSEALDGALYLLPTRARAAFERALHSGRRAFDLVLPLAQTLEPAPRPSLWRLAWRPAAAVGMLAVLATVPGSALPEQEQHRTKPDVAAVEVVPAAPAGTEILGKLSAADVDVLRAAIRRMGPGVLARPVVAEVFGLSEGQRQHIQAALDAHRQRVDQVVGSAAAGTPIDTGRAMRDARTATASSILRTLDDNQRAAWRGIAEDGSAGSFTL